MSEGHCQPAKGKLLENEIFEDFQCIRHLRFGQFSNPAYYSLCINCANLKNEGDRLIFEAVTFVRRKYVCVRKTYCFNICSKWNDNDSVSHHWSENDRRPETMLFVSTNIRDLDQDDIALFHLLFSFLSTDKNAWSLSASHAASSFLKSIVCLNELE